MKMRLFKQNKKDSWVDSRLFDEKTFYSVFIHDLLQCKDEVIIESPFIATERMKVLRPIFNKLLGKGIRIFVITRNPKEHEPEMEYQAETEITYFERIGVQTLLCAGNHHRKLAILDRKILWEGSLNILSQAHSREIMRRIENEEITMEMFDFLKLSSVL